MFDQLVLCLIMLCHFVVICFVVFVPFFGSNYLLLMHAITVPFIMIHWVLNDNTCVLTLMEKEARKRLNISVDEKDCFTCRLINPIYNFRADNNDMSTYIYVGTTILWLISVYRLYCGYANGSIRSLKELFMGRSDLAV